MTQERPVAPSRALAEEFRERIESGNLKPGQAVGSVASNAEETGQSVSVVKVAFKQLVDEGWLVTGAAREGHLVAQRPPKKGKRRLTLEERVERLERHAGIKD